MLAPVHQHDLAVGVPQQGDAGEVVERFVRDEYRFASAPRSSTGWERLG